MRSASSGEQLPSRQSQKFVSTAWHSGDGTSGASEDASLFWVAGPCRATWVGSSVASNLRKESRLRRYKFHARPDGADYVPVKMPRGRFPRMSELVRAKV
jgi:hypothetical protein